MDPEICLIEILKCYGVILLINNFISYTQVENQGVGVKYMS